MPAKIFFKCTKQHRIIANKVDKCKDSRQQRKFPSISMINLGDLIKTPGHSDLFIDTKAWRVTEPTGISFKANTKDRNVMSSEVNWLMRDAIGQIFLPSSY